MNAAAHLDALSRARPADLPALLASLSLVAPLLDAIPGVVFFVKDLEARYVLVNLTLAQRCGYADVSELLGKTAEEVFPAPLGGAYAEQDRRVLREGLALDDQLELHLYAGRTPGWCLTRKLPLHDAQGQLMGMAGISHDLQAPAADHPAHAKVAEVDRYLREHYAQPLSVGELSQRVGLSVSQLERQCKRILRLTPQQLLHKARLDAASRLLARDLPVTEVALACGYTDHSAFSRQFRRLTGLSPRQYRDSLKPRSRLEETPA